MSLLPCVRLCLATALCLLPPASAAAQYVAGPVHFSNPGSYTQTELEAASGVHTGTPVSGASLGAAAQRLSDTGAFEDVGATFTGPAKAVVVTFTLKPVPAASLLRASFSNLVWLTPEERDAALRAAMPLYHGSLALDEKIANAMDATLSAALAAKGAHATVTHLLAEPEPGRPDRVFNFTAGPQPVVVASLVVEGVPPAMAAAVNSLAASLKGSLYNEGLSGETTATAVLAPLLDAGYLDAHLSGSQRSPVSEPEATGVAMHASVEAGQPYHVTAIDFAGTPVMPAADFRAGLQLHPGDMAARKLLTQSLDPVRVAYLKGGYLESVVDAHPTLNPADHTVAYSVSVVPGGVYHLHSVSAENLRPLAQAEFNRGWLLKPGDVYNADYATHFLVNNTALRELQHYGAVFKSKADPETHLVDLVITFMPGPEAK